jgi:hypothetical protein
MLQGQYTDHETAFEMVEVELHKDLAHAIYEHEHEHEHEHKALGKDMVRCPSHPPHTRGMVMTPGRACP